MIKAIIFDCFGVLTTDSWTPFKAEHFGHDQALMEEVSEYFRRVDAGLADYEDFLSELASRTGMDRAVIRTELDKNVANAELFQFIRSLKPTYKIGMLSNAGDNWLSQLFSEEEIGLFDVISLSYETGVVKPQPEAYHRIAERLEVAPEQCVFIDDQPGYCEAARQLGMQAIEYRSLEQCRAELENVLDRSQ